MNTILKNIIFVLESDKSFTLLLHFIRDEKSKLFNIVYWLIVDIFDIF